MGVRTAAVAGVAGSTGVATTTTGAGFTHADLYSWNYTPRASVPLSELPLALDVIYCSNSTELNTALTTAAAGDRIVLDTDTRYEVDNPTLTASGTAANPIVVVADPALGDHAVEVSHVGGNGTNMMKFEGLSYWRFYNIFFSDTSSVYTLNIGNFDQANNDFPVQTDHSCDHFVIQSCKFQRANQTPIKIVNDTHDIQIIDCIFDDWAEVASSSSLAEAIYIGKGCTPSDPDIADNIDGCYNIDIIGCEWTDSSGTAYGGECVDAKFGTTSLRILHSKVHGVSFCSGAVSGIFGLSANYYSGLTETDIECAYNRFWSCATLSSSEPSCFLIGGGGDTNANGTRIHHNLANNMPVAFVAIAENFTNGYEKVHVHHNECWDMNQDVGTVSWNDRGTIGDPASPGTYTGDFTIETQVVENATSWPTGDIDTAVLTDFEGPTTGDWEPTSGSYQFELGGMEPDPAGGIPSGYGAFASTGGPG